jgi:hypothetical protein
MLPYIAYMDPSWDMAVFDKKISIMSRILPFVAFLIVI